MKLKLPSFSKKKPNESQPNTNTNNDLPEVKEIYHKQPLDELEQQLSTSVENGLDATKASQLLHVNGPNRIKQKRESMILKICGYFLSGFGTLFLFAAIVCMLAWRPLGSLGGQTPDPVNLALGVLLIAVIFIQAAFNAFQRVMNSIKNMMPSNAYVIRNGKEVSIPTEEIVVGDVVRLQYGHKVPADCRIIETKDLKFDKSMLTGECEAVEGTVECTDEKYVESKNIAYMTTLVTQGQGKGLVVATGDKTMMGKIAGLTNQTVHKKTSLQIEIHRFVSIICGIAIVSAIIVTIAWAAWLRVQYPTYILPVPFIVDIISVIIAFIPDGLPVSVTVSLLIIAIRMKKSRVLVKNLTVIETLSCVNVIASDKTGTLTQNKMFIASASAGIEKIDLDKVKDPSNERPVSFSQLVATCGLCNNASFEDNDTTIPIRQRKCKGDATDVALFKFSAEYQDYAAIQSNYVIRAEIPFNSKNKWMVKIIKPKEAEMHAKFFGVDNDMDSDIILLKGAPDYLVKKSTQVLLEDGSMVPIKPNINTTLIRIQNDWCVLGQRVLIICKKKCKYDKLLPSGSPISVLEKYIHESNDFCIIGLVGIIDPPREGIADVLAKCKTAGIRVLMVTGDYALTAAAIATQIGILSQSQYDTAESMRVKHKENSESYDNSSLLLTGNDLDTLSPEEWRLVTPYEEIVLARTTPEQKLKCVKEFQSDNYIVGVTGDGVNDAPALKSANIGIAMGSGSEVAMEASQLVLLDNNFASILIAIENGRLVFDNLRKVILFLLPAGSMGDFVPIIMTIFLGIPLNISSFGMLLISLITDIPPSLAMMKESPETDLLAQPPRTKKDHLTDRNFLIQAYIFMGTMVVLSSQIMYFIYMKWYMNMNPSQIFLAFTKIYDNYNQSNYEYLLTVIDPHNRTQLINYFNDQYYSAQTVTYTALVVIQTFGNLLCTRTHVKSFFQQPPWNKKKGNVWFFVGQVVAMFFLLIFIYVPWFHGLFNTRSLPVQFLFMPLFFCVIIFIADELRKLCVRHKWLGLHKIGW